MGKRLFVAVRRWLFGMNEDDRIGDLLSAAPGPSPWWLDGRIPTVVTKYGVGEWVRVGDGPTTTGKVVLKAGGRALAVFSFNNWVHSSGNSKLLIYSQEDMVGKPTPPLKIIIFDCDQAGELSNVDEICAQMTAAKTIFYSTGGVIAAVDIPTDHSSKSINVEFPVAFGEFGKEILALAHSSGLGLSSWEKNNLCILSLRPEDGRCEFYPQDWFNNGGHDYGYEWVTSVIRDPKTGKLCFSGIRIRGGVLDPSGRQLEWRLSD